MGKVLKELFFLRRGTWGSSLCARVASSGCASGLGYKAELAGHDDSSVLRSCIRERAARHCYLRERLLHLKVGWGQGCALELLSLQAAEEKILEK